MWLCPQGMHELSLDPASYSHFLCGAFQVAAPTLELRRSESKFLHGSDSYLPI